MNILGDTLHVLEMPLCVAAWRVMSKRLLLGLSYFEEYICLEDWLVVVVNRFKLSDTLHKHRIANPNTMLWMLSGFVGVRGYHGYFRIGLLRVVWPWSLDKTKVFVLDLCAYLHCTMVCQC